MGTNLWMLLRLTVPGIAMFGERGPAGMETRHAGPYGEGANMAMPGMRGEKVQIWLYQACRGLIEKVQIWL